MDLGLSWIECACWNEFNTSVLKACPKCQTPRGEIDTYKVVKIRAEDAMSRFQGEERKRLSRS